MSSLLLLQSSELFQSILANDWVLLGGGDYREGAGGFWESTHA